MSVADFSPLRVLIVAEHASAKFGGEAILPLHYFRLLRARRIEAWLIVHERTKDELTPLLGDSIDRVRWIPDTRLHRFLFALSRPFPHTISYFTFRRLMRLYSQVLARRIARQLIVEHHIDVVHQPIPVSPKESSLLHSLGVPVVIGPMNGGMEYPPGFGKAQPKWIAGLMGVGRFFSRLTNRLLPGKRRAAVLLVANERTRRALPPGVQGKVIELVENGVDLSLWQQPPACDPGVSPGSQANGGSKVQFAFSGRLVDWKAVHLLLDAFALVVQEIPCELKIIGNGPERDALARQAEQLGIARQVTFLGWLPQKDCAQALSQADIFVLPSLYECGGAVVLEAMALGLPVVATRWGGPADYLDASCGILVDPTTPAQFVNALAMTMKQLAMDEPARRQLGQAGRKKVEQQYDWNRKIDAILAIYGEARKGSGEGSGFGVQEKRMKDEL